MKIKQFVLNIPRKGWACGFVAFLVAFIWSLTVPPFHVPDEIAHFDYAQHLAETGMPSQSEYGPGNSEQVNAVLNLIAFKAVVGRADHKVVWDKSIEQSIKDTLKQPLSKTDSGKWTPSTNNPPLYYLTQYVPYKLASGTDQSVLDQLQAMRILSAIYAGFTILFIFLFLRELFPRNPWIWPGASLICAFSPVLSFISGGLNNDALLFTFAAALFFLLAYTFRRGLSAKRGALIGLVTVLGFMTKLTFMGLMPGVALALFLIFLRQKGDRRTAAIGMLSAVTVFAGLLTVLVLLNETVWNRSLWPASDLPPIEGAGPGPPKTVPDTLSYIWQYYLPKLPFMTDKFPGYYPLWNQWFIGMVGRFGWVDYSFPWWVNKFFLYFAALPVTTLFLASLARYRKQLLRRWPEILTYSLMTFGLIILIGIAASDYWNILGFPFEQPRYYLSALAVYAAVISLSCLALGQKWGRSLLLTFVIAAVAHNFFSLALTVERYFT